MWRVSAGVFEQPLVGLRPFGHARAECAGGGFDFRNAVVLRFGTVVAQDVVQLSRDQKSCARS